MHVGSYDVTVKPTVRNYSNSSRVEFIPRVDRPVNSEDLIRQIVYKVLVWVMIFGTDICVFFNFSLSRWVSWIHTGGVLEIIQRIFLRSRAA